MPNDKPVTILPHPVDQTAFKTETTRGNCMQASVASILSLNLDEVPNFVEEKHPWSKLHKFLRKRGFEVKEMAANYVPDVFYLATGQSPRGISHMVVCFGGKIIHDPHPSRDGVNIERVYILIPTMPYELNHEDHSKDDIDE